MGGIQGYAILLACLGRVLPYAAPILRLLLRKLDSTISLAVQGLDLNDAH
jgi:hypothetical protein